MDWGFYRDYLARQVSSARRQHMKTSAKTAPPPAQKREPKSAPAKKTSSDKLQLHGVIITHPDRVIEANTALTKGKLAMFYATVAPYVLRSVGNHPVTLVRCPEGIGGESFYQRNPGRGLGPDVLP